MPGNVFATIGLNVTTASAMLDCMLQKGLISSSDPNLVHFSDISIFFDGASCSQFRKYTISEDRIAFIYGVHYFPFEITKETWNLLWDDVKWGKIYNYIHGHFVIFAINLKTTPTFTIVTDPLGLIHVYLRKIDNHFFISSSSNLLASVGYRPDLDVKGCLEFAATGTLFEELTFFSEISKVLARTRLTFEQCGEAFKLSTSRIDNYWQDSEYVDLSSCEEACSLLVDQVMKAALSIGKSFSRCLLDVTGGFDSRLVLAAFQSSGVSFEGTVTSGYDSIDQLVARTLSTKVGFNLSQIDINELLIGISEDDLFNCLKNSDGELGIIETFGVYLLKKHYSEIYDIGLTGTGGELLRGRWWEGEGNHIGNRHEINTKQIVKRLFPYGCEWSPFDSKMASLCDNEITNYVQKVSHMLSGEVNTRIIDFLYADHRIQHWAGSHISNTNKIMPCISPLLMGKIPQLSYYILPNIKNNSAVVRLALSVMHRQIALVPMDNGGPALPLSEFSMSDHLRVKMNQLKSCYSSILTKFFHSNRQSRFRPFPKFISADIVEDLLDYNNMESAFLYDRKRFELFLKRKQRGSVFQLSRMFTLEWALRNAKHSVVRWR